MDRFQQPNIHELTTWGFDLQIKAIKENTWKNEKTKLIKL